jgi:hypothetical protein
MQKKFCSIIKLQEDYKKIDNLYLNTGRPRI